MQKEHWPLIQREKQKAPNDFEYWILYAGRGFGKTRCASENIVDMILQKQFQHIAFINSTCKHVNNIMIHGSSGILQGLMYRQWLFNNKELILNMINNM